jgi:hypothetical protein
LKIARPRPGGTDGETEDGKSKNGGRAQEGNETEEGSKAELIDTGTDKRYVRRNPKGQFKESDDVGALAVSRSPDEGEDQGQVGTRRPRRPLIVRRLFERLGMVGGDHA